MATVAEAIFADELAALVDVALGNGWPIASLTRSQFVLRLPARDGQFYFVSCAGVDYAGLPAAWQWCGEVGAELGHPKHCPAGSGYFHGSNVICAPWNRLAYQDVGGPHGDWVLSAWKQSPQTNGCISLASMALRLFVELSSSRYHGRRS